MTDPRDLLDAARTDASVRGVLADRIREDDGDTPAAETLSRCAGEECIECEQCGCPDGAEFVGWDQYGKCWQLREYQYIDPGTFMEWDFQERRTCVMGPHRRARRPRVEFRAWDRWYLLCPFCVRSLAARKANATRRANRQARADAAPNLFSGVDDDG